MDDDGVDDVLAALEGELRGAGRLAFVTCEEVRRDGRLAGLEGCLAFLRCTVFAADPDLPAIPRRRRVHACRLMLLSIGAHTVAPQWTAFQVEQLFEAAIQIPGAELSDLVQAQFALLAETPGPMSSAQAAFVRELGRQIACKRRRGHAADDFVWIALRLADPVLPVSQAQAYFATHALPRRLRRASREIILRAMHASPLAGEVAQALAEPDEPRR